MVLKLPVALLVPLQYLIVVGAQLVTSCTWWELPCQDARDPADPADRAVPAGRRVRLARAVGGLRGRPVVEALVRTSADAEREVAEAGPGTLCTIWRRDGFVGEDLLLKLHPHAQGRVRAWESGGAEPMVKTSAMGRARHGPGPPETTREGRAFPFPGSRTVSTAEPCAPARPAEGS
ncbi:hypothetical protein [Streptomyces subrutilus]|uniref:hypothetical protein n=1 Tax=Streptomyces subrutilus TaxID=36818 RepID=UPI002E13A771|nr:hypothetical protein OG479_33510 [Streptomyces subrutilus]